MLPGEGGHLVFIRAKPDFHRNFQQALIDELNSFQAVFRNRFRIENKNGRPGAAGAQPVLQHPPHRFHWPASMRNSRWPSPA